MCGLYKKLVIGSISLISGEKFMKFKLVALFCLNVAMVHAAPFQTVFDYNDGLLLLEDGSVWEVEVDGSEVFVKGDIVDEALFEGELLGRISEESVVSHAFDFVIKNENEEESKVIYGHISRLENGEVFLGLNSDPYKLEPGQRISLARFDGGAYCLVNKENLSIINAGINLGTTLNLPAIRTVVEETEFGYVFDDGFVLEQSLKPGIDSMELLGKKISFQFDPLEPMKLYLEVEGDEEFSKISIDCSTQFYFEVDFTAEIFDEDRWNESIIFLGSKTLKEAFIPSDLKKGERLSFYHISNPLFGEELEMQFYFVTRN